MKAKSLFKSKSFWLNVLGIAAFVQPVIPLDPKMAAIVWGAVGVATRIVTKGPVVVLEDAATEP